MMHAGAGSGNGRLTTGSARSRFFSDLRGIGSWHLACFRIGSAGFAPVVTLLLVALLSLPSNAATKKAAPKGTGNPFDLLKGYWTGGGTIGPGKKTSPERVSCHVTYNVAGESTYDASGTVSGSAVGNTVHAVINGDKFSGRMSINVSGSSHTINIVQLDPKSGTYRQASASRYTARLFSEALTTTSRTRGLEGRPMGIIPSLFSLPFVMPNGGVAQLQQSSTNFLPIKRVQASM